MAASSSVWCGVWAWFGPFSRDTSSAIKSYRQLTFLWKKRSNLPRRLDELSFSSKKAAAGIEKTL
jgi:hypothetical protein